MQWNAISAIATVVSMVAFIATAVFLALELRGYEKSRYFQISSELYSTWQSREFMEAQLWLIHRLTETTWADFVAAHRADYGEQAFHRVGSFYDRVGTLVRLGLIEQREILSTIAPYAIAVWKKIQPLVREARVVENSVLFDDFERILPACYECYVPEHRDASDLAPFEIREAPRVSVAGLRSRLDRGSPTVVLDVRNSADRASDPRTLPGAIVIDPVELPERLHEIPAGPEVFAYCA